MDIQTIKTHIDISRIWKEVSTFVLTDDSIDQICLQGYDIDMDPYFGSRELKSMKGYTEWDFCVNLFPKLEYTNEIIEELRMYRTRVMRMAPKSCLSYHKDPTRRVHIPLITNTNAFLLIDKSAYNLIDDGSAYLVDTKKMHTAINASFVNRIHLVGVVDEKVDYLETPIDYAIPCAPRHI
jgi:hypothetical protein